MVQFGFNDFDKSDEGFLIGERSVLGLFKPDGTVIVPFQFDMFYVVEDFIYVQNGSLWGLYDLSGKLILDCKYSSIGWVREGMVGYMMKDKFGYVAISGEFDSGAIYDEVQIFRNGLGPIRCGEYWGFIDYKGNVKISLKYDDALFFDNGKAQIGLNGKRGTIDTNGNETWE